MIPSAETLNAFAAAWAAVDGEYLVAVYRPGVGSCRHQFSVTPRFAEHALLALAEHRNQVVNPALLVTDRAVAKFFELLTFLDARGCT